MKMVKCDKCANVVPLEGATHLNLRVTRTSTETRAGNSINREFDLCTPCAVRLDLSPGDGEVTTDAEELYGMIEAIAETVAEGVVDSR